MKLFHLHGSNIDFNVEKMKRDNMNTLKIKAKPEKWEEIVKMPLMKKEEEEEAEDNQTSPKKLQRRKRKLQ